MQTIGIIGAGQLGRMMALAGYPLGLEFLFLDKSADTPGGQVGPIITGAYDDPAGIQTLAERVDALTFDVENVPVEPLLAITQHTPLHPGTNALEVAQDRLFEKRLFVEQGLDTPAFQPADSLAELQDAVNTIGLPAVVKTRRMGYDGKGQHMLRCEADIHAAWEAIGGVPLIVEQFIDYDYEVSIIGVRARDGECRYYPLARNTHHDGVLHHSIAPFTDADLQAKAQAHSRTLLSFFDYVGVLTIEFFVRDGQLIANEIAPRVHNSGHWTIEGAETSQFENHIRAVAGLPLGNTAACGHSAMVNFLGAVPPIADVLNINGAHVHDYGKSPRPGRKLGHATLHANRSEDRDAALAALREIMHF